MGFVGILLVLDPFSGFDGDTGPLGYLACLGATLSYGMAFVYMRRFASPPRARRDHYRDCTSRPGGNRHGDPQPTHRQTTSRALARGGGLDARTCWLR